MRDRRTLRVGIAGLGVVGQGVWQHLDAKADALEHRLGVRLVPWKASVRDLRRPRDVQVPADRLTTDPLAVARDPDVDIVCELMGGTDLAAEVTRAALEAGKSVVTANKALLCEQGEKLFPLAREKGGRIYFEASVAGGIPIIKAVREGLIINDFRLIYGILNGTCNYILTRMQREGKEFGDIVGDARRLGYVEADESLDLDGWDAAHKTVVLAYLAHGLWIPLSRVDVEGIREVTLGDIEWARKLGYRIKLLCVISRDFQSERVFASVHPTLVPERMVLATVDEVYNAVSVTGDIVGESVYIGRGAGRHPTASAVISDLADAARDILHRVPEPPPPRGSTALRLATADEIERPFYLRLAVQDRTGVLAHVAIIMARHRISIESVLQMPSPRTEAACLVLTTHRTSERQMRDAVTDLRAESAVLEKPFLLRIADFSS